MLLREPQHCNQQLSPCTCSLFNDAVNNPDYTEPNDWMIENDVEKSRRNYDALSQNFPADLRKIKRNFSQGSWCPGRDSNWAPPEYKSEELSLQPTSLVKRLSK
jgi:hypothetical protein